MKHFQSLTISVLLTFVSLSCLGQISTIPIKPGMFQDSILNGKATYEFLISTDSLDIWVNQYKSKYYSNWPYKVIFNKKTHIFKVIDVQTSHVIYVGNGSMFDLKKELNLKTI